MWVRLLKPLECVLLVAAGVSLSGCFGGGASIERAAPAGAAHINNKTKFSQSRYGVAASPRVTTSRHVRKGGGRAQIGKPYKIKGKWYTPREEPGYDRTGNASWYGPNFHGRLTANGEVYDQYALSAAHPTFPLPSYARVTNVKNGRSVVVRVNDRGPYHDGRIIDLSARASHLLDYQKSGIARVRVEYMGRAPLHGLDASYLAASYRDNGDTAPVATATAAIRPPVAIDRILTGSIKPKSQTADPFLNEIQQIRSRKDTGSTLALRLKTLFTRTDAQ